MGAISFHSCAAAGYRLTAVEIYTFATPADMISSFTTLDVRARYTLSTRYYQLLSPLFEILFLHDERVRLAAISPPHSALSKNTRNGIKIYFLDAFIR